MQRLWCMHTCGTSRNRGTCGENAEFEPLRDNQRSVVECQLSQLGSNSRERLVINEPTAAPVRRYFLVACAYLRCGLRLRLRNVPSCDRGVNALLKNVITTSSSINSGVESTPSILVRMRLPGVTGQGGPCQKRSVDVVRRLVALWIPDEKLRRCKLRSTSEGRSPRTPAWRSKSAGALTKGMAIHLISKTWGLSISYTRMRLILRTCIYTVTRAEPFATCTREESIALNRDESIALDVGPGVLARGVASVTCVHV